MKKVIILIMSVLYTFNAMADGKPYIQFSWSLTDGTGETVTTTDMRYEGSAPITATMTVRAVYDDDEGLAHDCQDATFLGAWCVWSEGGQMEQPELSRAEPVTELFFRSFGTDSIAYVGTVTIDGQVHEISPEYNRTENHIFAIKTYESKLTFPNAFSPNGDGFNDTYRAKDCQSIVEFHAAIYNRWGQRLFQWTNPQEGWDGTFNGTPVKDGVYYVQVKAKGADGQTFVIKKDVNLLRKFEELNQTVGQ